MYEDNIEVEENKSPSSDSNQEDDSKFSVNYTVGWIEDGTAILLSKDHNLIEIPLCLLPPTIGPGNILWFGVQRNQQAENWWVKEILAIQKQILEDPNFFDD